MATDRSVVVERARAVLGRHEHEVDAVNYRDAQRGEGMSFDYKNSRVFFDASDPTSPVMFHCHKIPDTGSERGARLFDIYFGPDESEDKIERAFLAAKFCLERNDALREEEGEAYMFPLHRGETYTGVAGRHMALKHVGEMTKFVHESPVCVQFAVAHFLGEVESEGTFEQVEVWTEEDGQRKTVFVASVDNTTGTFSIAPVVDAAFFFMAHQLEASTAGA